MVQVWNMQQAMLAVLFLSKANYVNQTAGARLIMLNRQLVSKLLLWRAKRLNLQHHQLCIHYIQAGVAKGYVYCLAVLQKSTMVS